MGRRTAPFIAVLVAVALSSCSHRGEAPASAGLTEDDDVFCRKGGQVGPGSPEYVNCRKDRDSQRGNNVHTLAEILPMPAYSSSLPCTCAQAPAAPRVPPRA